MTSLKQKIVSGVLWQGLDRIGSIGLQFVIQIVLARLLAPEQFGIIAVMMVFILLCQCFIDSGFSSALIQKKDIDEKDCNSVFYINIFTAAAIYAIMFFVSPYIAIFYKTPEICSYLRVLMLVIVIRSFSLVQFALLNKRMMFYLNFRISMAAVVASGAAGIFMAYRGFGVWALIVQQLVFAAATGILQWALVKWRPQLIFAWSRVKQLFFFGWKLLCSSLLDTLYNDLYTILIGKLFSLQILAFYQQGRRIPMLGMGVINSTIGSVIFPAFATLQDDREKMRDLAQRSLKLIMFVITPILGVLMITAEPLVKILLTEKWSDCVIYLQLSCIIALFWPLHTLNLQIITACGRSDVFLILEIIKKIQAVIIIAITYRYGVLPMVIGLVCSTPLGFIENSFFNGKLIKYPWWRQFFDFCPFMLGGVCAGGVGYIALMSVSGVWLKLIAGGVVFAIVYLAFCFISRLIPDNISEILRKKKKA